MNTHNDTIAAIATAPGNGGVAIIRISGEKAVEIADALFARSVEKMPSHTVRFGKFHSIAGEFIDEVLIVVMRAPTTYTGEDVVEVHCHGGRLITKRVLQAILDAGALPAGPGDFTRRAFLNGRIDLTRAEAIQEVIGAQNERSLAAAREHLAGYLAKAITAFQRKLADVTAIVEAWVDYPEEGLEYATPSELISALEDIKGEMEGLTETFHDGKIISEGLSLCLLGAPNVGKSSLMNALLGRDRAIVTHIAGTTRDLLEEPLRIGDLHFQLTDTAGIRTTTDIIEQEGIRRSKSTAMEADIILCLLDSSRHLTDEESILLSSLPPEKTVVVWNKSDLATELQTVNFPIEVRISAKTGSNLENLKKVINEKFCPSAKPLTLTSERHYRALTRSLTSLSSAISGLKDGISPDLLASDLRASLHHLSTIIGIDVTEEILSAIFSKFCVGK
ncbi:MAG: tRNA uridine-5-carboxymethylaminomethyl(34) synthesis GTPase MnmE [Simkaniaceae bacterium]|nr:tRNA uridine-5-carboxymethylaminomethyl(34) synthesis GTPase MnmE [Simkaniaceae bacterium]